MCWKNALGKLKNLGKLIIFQDEFIKKIFSQYFISINVRLLFDSTNEIVLRSSTVSYSKLLVLCSALIWISLFFFCQIFPFKFFEFRSQWLHQWKSCSRRWTNYETNHNLMKVNSLELKIDQRELHRNFASGRICVCSTDEQSMAITFRYIFHIERHASSTDFG